MRRSLGWLAVAALAALSALGCSDTVDDAPFATPAPLASTTTVPREGTLVDPGDVVADPEGRTPAEIAAALEGALADEDTCELVAVLDDDPPDVSDPAAVVVVYGDVADAVAAARSFVPDVLAEPWETVVDAAATAADAAERSGGDVGDPALRAAFDTAEFTSAFAAVDAWAIDNCG